MLGIHAQFLGSFKLQHRVAIAMSHTRNSQFLHAFIGLCNIFWWSKVWFWNKFFDICSSPRSRICPYGFIFDIRLLSFIALISTSFYIFLVDVLKLLWTVKKLLCTVKGEGDPSPWVLFFVDIKNRSSIFVCRVNTKTQRLLSCQQRIGLEVMGYPVQTNRHNIRSKQYTWSSNCCLTSPTR